MRATRAAALAATPAVMGVALALGFGSTPVDQAFEPASVTWTVDGREYPQCVHEDCSDVPGQIGVWIDPDTGDHWLSTGPERSVRVDRALEPGGYVPGVPGTNPLDVFAPTRCTDTDAYAREVGDDDCDGTIAAGESGTRPLYVEGCGWDVKPNDDAGCAD